MTHEKSEATSPQPASGVGIAQLKSGTWIIQSAANNEIVGWVVVEAGAAGTSVEHWYYSAFCLPEGKPVLLNFSPSLTHDTVKAQAKALKYLYVKATCSPPEKLA